MPDPADLTDRFLLQIIYGDDVRPADADLDAFEARFQIRLPDEYRHFVKTLGAGEIEGVSSSCYIYAPGGPPGIHATADLAYLNSFDPLCLSPAPFLRYKCSLPNPDPDLLDLHRRVDGMIFFCRAGEGVDMFAWQPAEVTDPATHEMAIYLVQVDYLKVERVAGTFRQFLLDYLLSGRYTRENFPAAPADSHPDLSDTFSYIQHIYSYPVDDEDVE